MRPPPRGSLVLLDTNATFLPFREGLPLAREVDRLLPGARLAVPTVVEAELDLLIRRATPHALAARAFARSLPSVPSLGRGDAAVAGAAIRLRAAVVTADRLLAERLRRSGVAVLVPRDRTRLELKPPRPTAGSGRSPRARKSAAKG